MKKYANDLRVGDRFPSPRVEEGTVIAVCPFGQCDHDDRPMSIHVRGNNQNEFFVAMVPNEIVHVCGDSYCGNDQVAQIVPGMTTRWVDHKEANTHAR